MKAQEFDLIVIGGGSGGLAGAFRASAHGAKVALLEPKELGGTCVNVGCVPKKAMWLAADLSQKIVLSAQLGFNSIAPVLDWPEFVVHRQRYIAGIHASYRRRLDESGVVLMPCHGRLLDAHTVVNADGVELQGRHILVATGGHPHRPEIPGAELGLVSDDFFNLCSAPERVAIVGGGYVAVELAGVLQGLGSQVELFVRGQCLLSSFDAELTDELLADMRQHGVHVHFGHDLAAVEKASGDGVVLVAGDGSRSERFDALIFATGRHPNTAGIGLEAAGVEVDHGGHVRVDEYQNTTAAQVYAVGDVTGRAALTPVAIAAARRLMDRVFGGQRGAKLDYDDIATVVFSHPPIGTVGLTEQQARERHGDGVKVLTAHFRPMLHALADSPQRSLFKLVCTGKDDRVVGIHLLGEGADEILQGFAVALKKGITLADLHDTVAIHPTSAEELVLMR
ncbi:glutathione-disulfide reductase [Pseudoxanthomonas putridarboris]|uniref:Glutathione-disulfide reductase n=1 Tax=Pseudoxanthomonas putridarboris TaxID=752605 RepID=A0ABU9J3J4_9GAMM